MDCPWLAHRRFARCSTFGDRGQATCSEDGVATADSTHEIRQFFRPEFFNRIDRLVHFNAMGRDSIASIAQQELHALERREGLLRRGLRLRFTPAVVDFVASVGFSPRYGARPLQRAVEQHVPPRIV